MNSYKLWIGGRWANSDQVNQVHSPFDGRLVAETHQASEPQMETAIQESLRAFEAFKHSSRFVRGVLLRNMAQAIENNREKFIEKMIQEAGKPRTAADVEVTRAVTTFTLAAEESRKFIGEILPMDLDASGRAYEPAICRWVPRGPILGIAPFNFPLNLVAHKVAPALAVGASILLKPPPQAPGCATLLAEIFEKSAKEISSTQDMIPLGAFQVVNAANEIMAAPVKDPRLTVLSFTGSDKVGWMLQGQAIRKKVLLELGGNAGVIIHRDGDIARAVQRCVAGGFGYAGQTCISVQRIFVHEEVRVKFTQLLLEGAGKIVCGDPAGKDVTVGPLIDRGAADRVEQWVSEAEKKGAKILLKGKRLGNVIGPTILSDVPDDCRVSCEEVFGPVVIIEGFTEFKNALKRINESRFGLQSGVFTDSAKLIRQAFEALEVGAVIINDVPTFRADQMPYGGVKDSGLGREGLRYAMEDYCERRTLVTWKGE